MVSTCAAGVQTGIDKAGLGRHGRKIRRREAEPKSINTFCNRGLEPLIGSLDRFGKRIGVRKMGNAEHAGGSTPPLPTK